MRGPRRIGKSQNKSQQRSNLIKQYCKRRTVFLMDIACLQESSPIVFYRDSADMAFWEGDMRYDAHSMTLGWYLFQGIQQYCSLRHVNLLPVAPLDVAAGCDVHEGLTARELLWT